jgi:hypothetical protein
MPIRSARLALVLVIALLALARSITGEGIVDDGAQDAKSGETNYQRLQALEAKQAGGFTVVFQVGQRVVARDVMGRQKVFKNAHPV